MTLSPGQRVVIKTDAPLIDAPDPITAEVVIVSPNQTGVYLSFEHPIGVRRDDGFAVLEGVPLSKNKDGSYTDLLTKSKWELEELR